VFFWCFFGCHIARLSVWFPQADSLEIHRFHPLNILFRLGAAPFGDKA
jgi:hypothetical protein